MANPDFSEYLSAPTGDIQAPKAFPAGHYYALVGPRTPKESKNGSPMMVQQFILQSPGEDVDTSLLPPTGIQGKKVSTNFVLNTEFGMFAMKEMVAAAGVEMDPAQGIGVYLPQTDNRPVMIVLDTRLMDPNDPDSREANDVKKILPPN